MQPISGAQVRMARSLLKMTREQLAKAANVSCGTIRTFEDDIPVRDSIAFDLQIALDQRGAEFLPDGSVRPRVDQLTDFRGPNSCDRFFESIVQAVREKGGEVLCHIETQNMLTKATGRFGRTNFDRMQELQKIVPVKCLLRDGKFNMPTLPSFEVRVFSESETMTAASFFTYGAVSTIGLETDHDHRFNHPAYIVLNNPHRAQRSANLFMHRWDVAKTNNSLAA